WSSSDFSKGPTQWWRYLAYKEGGIEKEKAKHKIIDFHGFDSSKDLITQNLIQEFHIYVLQYDCDGYGESDSHPKRSVKSEAFDNEELANKLHLGPKFCVITGKVTFSVLLFNELNVQRSLAGVALVVPFVSYWWSCYPAKLSKEALGNIVTQDQQTF
ncbi:hypothetical protein H5410_002766, partial [Solanum commersonii]